MLNEIGVISVLALAAPTFGVYLSIIASLTLEIAALLQLQLNFGINLPTLALNLALVVELLASLQLALEITFPDINVNFNLQFTLMLELLLGIVAALELALSVGGVAGIEALTFYGAGSDLGAGLSGSGVFTSDDVTAVVIGATSSAAAAVLGEMFDGLTFEGGINVIGELTLSAMLSGTFELLLDLFGEFSARAKALAKISASISVTPPSVAGSITLLLKIQAAIKAAIAIGMPSVTANLFASLTARISIIEALVAKISASLSWGTDGFDVFTYTGPGDGLGPALTGRLASGWPDGAAPEAPSNVIVLAATTPAASAALTTFFPVAA